jgi:hypothetical protein
MSTFPFFFFADLAQFFFCKEAALHLSFDTLACTDCGLEDVDGLAGAADRVG